MNNWIKKGAIYHVLIDRFAGCLPDSNDQKPGFCGGNLRAITEKLDCIRNMGITTLWISPFYENTSYHGYHITNFDKVDKRFGTKDDLKELIDCCHEKDLRIIADIVPNHCSIKHPWFADAVSNPESNYRHRFYFTRWPGEYLCFLDFRNLPKINLENPETSDYMLYSLTEWAKLGFDGFRIDHVLGIPDAFLTELRRRLVTINPAFVLIGEAWAGGMRHKYLKTLRLRGRYNLWRCGFGQFDIQKHYEGILDGVLDFGWRDRVLSNLKAVKLNLSELNKRHKEYESGFSKDFLLPRFLDNHDTNRIMHECKNNRKLFIRLLKLLASQNQPVIIYYGTEYGLTHEQSVVPGFGYSDLNARRVPPWSETPEFYGIIKDILTARK